MRFLRSTIVLGLILFVDYLQICSSSYLPTSDINLKEAKSSPKSKTNKYGKDGDSKSSTHGTDIADAAIDVSSQKTFGEAVGSFFDKTVTVTSDIISTSSWPFGPILGGGLKLIYSSFRSTEDSDRQAQEEADRAAQEKADRTAQAEADRATQVEANRFNQEAYGTISVEMTEIHNEISSLRLDIKELSLQLGVVEGKVMEEVRNLENLVISESRKIVEDLTKVVKGVPFLTSMRQTLENIKFHYSNSIACVLDVLCTGDSKKKILEEMMNPFSNYRDYLRTFTTKYIKPKTDLHVFDPENMFFDYVLQKHKLLEAEHDDCYSESYHTRTFKSYMYIAKVLTDGYSLVAAAHAVRHRQYIESREILAAHTARNDLARVINEYLDQMHTFMTETKMALNQSSKEIRKCAPTHFQETEAFHSFDLHDNLLNPIVLFSLAMCRGYPPKTNPGNGDSTPLNDNGVERNSFETLVMNCSGYNEKRKIKFSTQRAEAQLDYVVTGIRWRIREDVLYIDIQEGKFIDGTQVDKKSLNWIETEKNDTAVMVLHYKNNNLLLDDFTLPDNYYVIGVQMVRIDDMISLSVNGVEADHNGAKLSDVEEFAIRKEEIDTEELSFDSKDPKDAPSNLKNVMMRDQGRFHVKFRTIGFEAGTYESLSTSKQQAVPYLNMQEVMTYPPAPIGGIGIYHEAVPGYGGFVGLKIITPNFSNMIDMEKFEAYIKMFQLRKNPAEPKRINKVTKKKTVPKPKSKT